MRLKLKEHTFIHPIISCSYLLSTVVKQYLPGSVLDSEDGEEDQGGSGLTLPLSASVHIVYSLRGSTGHFPL